MMVNHWGPCSKYSSRALFVGALFILIGFSYCLEFTSEPQSGEVESGKEFSLTCVAKTDNGPITYSWKKDGRTFKTNSRKTVSEDGGQSVLSINPVEKSDRGNYNCLAEDSISEKITSQAAQLVVYSLCDAPTVTKTTDVFLLKGGQVTLKCRCNHSPTNSAKVEWTKDDIILKESSNLVIEDNKLTISNLDDKDEGVYGCSLTNTFAVAKSPVQDSFNLELAAGSPPQILKKPEDVIVARRKPAMLDCKYIGDPIPQQKWMFNEKKVRNDANHIALLPNGSLSFIQFLPEDEGRYTCSVSNKFNSVSSSADVSLAYISKINPIEPVSVLEGVRAQLECFKPKGLPSPQLEWKMEDGSPLPNDPRYSVNCDSSSRVCILNIDKTKGEDSAKFLCIASNGMAKSKKKLAKLTILVEPKIYNPPKDLVVIEGDFVEMVCQASGSPQPRIKWEKEGVKNNSRLAIKAPAEIHANGSLIIRHAVGKDSGNYYCDARTITGWEESRKAKLTVREKVKMSDRHQNARMIDAGKDARLLCMFDGDVPITVRWSRVGKKLPKRAKANNASLTIRSASTSDNGIYKCKASNGFSEAVAFVNVTIVVFPKFVITPSNTTVQQSSSVWLHCNATGDPKPVISWSREKQGGDKLDKERFIQHQNGSMQIKNVQVDDDGNYYCIAGNLAHLAQVTVRLQVLANDEKTPKQSPSMARTIGIAVGCAAAYIVLVVGLMIYCKGRRVQYARKKSVINGTLTQGDNKPEEEMALNHLNAVYKRRGSYDKWQFPRHDLEALSTLGNGVYGRCFLAKAGGIKDGEKETTVIVKALMSKEEAIKDDFMQEMDMMCRIQNENIVQLLGLCKEEDPYYIISETLEKGDLKTFLRVGRTAGLNASQKISICSQIASGMNYLSAHEYIHKDLATRNILISKDLQVKIGFMSLNQDANRADYYLFENSLIPLRWMPSEAIFEKEYSDKSDVWSFGVTVWEVFTHGKVPYEDCSDEEVLKCIRSDNLKLARPEHCTPDVFEIMSRCWETDPAGRPTFGELSNDLSDLDKDSNV